MDRAAPHTLRSSELQVHRRAGAPWRKAAALLDIYALVPVLAIIYATVVSPMITKFMPPIALHQAPQPRMDSRFFWPALMATAIGLALRYRDRLAKLVRPPNIIALLAYLGLAGLSILWSCEPYASTVRWMQQAMVITALVLPTLLTRADVLRGLFLWCYAPAVLLNIYFVLVDNPPELVESLVGYPGYFNGKNYLGEFAGICLLLVLYEICFTGWRKIWGLVVGAVTVFLIYMSDCKSTLGFAVVAPILAALTLWIRRMTRLSPAVILALVPIVYFSLGTVSNFNIYRISGILFGDPTLTNRTIIWDFSDMEIAKRPLLGWGYQAFWLSGLDAPSATEGPGWVASMPEGHNGYLDTEVELGYVGLGFLLVFVFTTLHGIGGVADRAPKRARLLLSLALYVICHNILESLWMRGFEFLWVVFLIVAAETARFWQPVPARRRRARLVRRAEPAARLPDFARAGTAQGGRRQ